MRTAILILASSLFFAAAHSYAAESKTYKWTDENGVVHYGDHVPARYSKSRTEVLNSQGVTVNVIEAEKTATELAEDIRIRRLEEEKLAAEAARRAYDQSLIDSYTSVDEILATRKRRLSAVDGQIIFTTHRIGLIKNQIAAVQNEINRLSERQRKKGMQNPEIPKRLTDELGTATEALEEHEAILEAQYLEQARIRIKYAEDIERYKYLRGINDRKTQSG